MLQVYGALIHACSREIQHMRPINRRLQLVLLERAATVFNDMEKARIMPDSVIWNAFIAAAGRAGQLQRAFDALNRMQVRLYVQSCPFCFVEALMQHHSLHPHHMMQLMQYHDNQLPFADRYPST